MHAMLRIGGVKVAVKDEDAYDPGPGTLGGTPVIMAVVVTDAVGPPVDDRPGPLASFGGLGEL